MPSPVLCFFGNRTKWIAELLNEHYQTKRAAKAEAQATHTQTMAGAATPASNNITSTEEKKMAEVNAKENDALETHIDELRDEIKRLQAANDEKDLRLKRALALVNGIAKTLILGEVA